MANVFISYVRENSAVVERLAHALRVHGVKVWLDKNQIKPGYRWADAIRDAISEGDFFIACFSVEYFSRPRTYMNEELTLAIEELRRRPTDRAWFIPVLLSKCDIPNRSIGAGETLRSIQWEPLYENWDQGIKRIVSVIQPASQEAPEIQIPTLTDDEWRILLHRIQKGNCTPFIGPAACYGVLPHTFELAREWAIEHNYQMENGSATLEDVAQYLASHFDQTLPNRLLQERFKQLAPPDFTDLDEPHTVLAKLPLPVFLTSNYDDFIFRALKGVGKNPQREFCRWNQQLLAHPGSIVDERVREPTIESPLVFHFYGHTDVPESLVLTTDDYTTFLANVSKNENLLPLRIRKALVNSLPLFFGYNLSDKNLRVLIQAVRIYFEISPFRRHDNYRTGTLREFATALRQRWEAFSDER